MIKLILITGCFLISILTSAQMTIQFGEVEKLSDKVNTDSEEIMPMVSGDNQTLYFVRARDERNVGGDKTGHDIWEAKKVDKDFVAATNELGKLNNKGNNAIVGVSKSNTTFYVLNAYTSEAQNHMGIASVAYDKKWSEPKVVTIENIEYASDFYGFYVDPTETVLFISMQGPGTAGLEDLYVSTRNGDKWGVPKRLEGGINSTGYEMSPFLSQDGKRLYFSSNGHGGSGGADIFYAERQDEGWTKWSEPINLGPSVNSSAFDAYFVEGPDSLGYFASNRASGYSDIYRLKISWKEEEKEVVEVAVEETVTEPVEPEPVSTTPANLPIPAVGNIYFDKDKASIGPGSKTTLDALVKILKERPEIKITIEGHADNRYTEEHNQVLSENRANSVRKYLVNKGIKSSRIKTVGKGESEPDVPCEECTEEELQKNRRVEFTLNE